MEIISFKKKKELPIAVAIARIEGDNAILADAQTLLADVREEICTALPTSLETAVLKYIKKRRLLPEAHTCHSCLPGGAVVKGAVLQHQLCHQRPWVRRNQACYAVKSGRQVA